MNDADRCAAILRGKILVHTVDLGGYLDGENFKLARPCTRCGDLVDIDRLLTHQTSETTYTIQELVFGISLNGPTYIRCLPPDE
jgi:hypothetical protein